MKGSDVFSKIGLNHAINLCLSKVKQHSEEQGKELADVNMSTAVIKFQRTIRRLSVLRRFAKEMGMEFDIENMEISHFML